MPREIKFRAWDNVQKHFVYFELFRGVNNHTPDMYGFADLEDWQKFTALKDKNGKEIYEGDILKGTVYVPQLFIGDTEENCNFKMGGIVYWDYVGFNLKVIQFMCDPKRNGLINYFSFIGNRGEIFEEIEVIGNIYEHSHLLDNTDTKV